MSARVTDRIIAISAVEHGDLLTAKFDDDGLPHSQVRLTRDSNKFAHDAPALAARTAPLRGARLLLEIQTHLRLKIPVSRLGRDLTERSGIDVQVWITRSRMIEHVLRIHAERQVLGLMNADALLDVRIEVPAARSLDCA